MMAIFPDINQQTIFLSRSDSSEPLSSFAYSPFKLDDAIWPSVEHYFQAMKFIDPEQQAKIRQAKNPTQARKAGRSRLKEIRADWKTTKQAFMTRAIYTKCRTYPEIAQQLIDSHPNQIIENSQYDYFWGCGRDRRGQNYYGKILMAVRDKLMSE